MRKILTLLSFLLAVGLMAAPVFGQVDPQFAIGTGLGTACQTGQCGIGTGSISGEVNPIGGTFDVWQTSNSGQHTLNTPTVNPILIVVGIPDQAGSGAPGAMTISGGTFGYTGTGQLGPAAPVWQGGAGTGAGGGNGWGNWNASGAGNGGSNDWTGTPNNAGDFLATPDENSEQFTNWTTIEGQIGNPTTTFHMWVYEVNLNQAFTGQTGFNATIAGLPFGSIVFAQACNDFVDCTGMDNEFFTPFTTTGIAQDVPTPEPASMGLLGTALLGAYGLLRRRLKA